MWKSLLDDAKQRNRYRRLEQMEDDKLLQLRIAKDILKLE